ncbi:MAG TPA: tetratricopeptide repeat protein, partial [Tepidisphaeraceae bacterium]|nr:tetratricopeptide repeat protein [Tepidisphaeraceae bacterium]
ACTFIDYLPSINGTMVWDDNYHITQPQLQSLHGLEQIWFNPRATHQYYPVLHSAFWVEHQIWGDHVVGYHLINILLHAMSACLLAVILTRLKIPGAYLAAAIFALHPVHVESVAWMSEQKNVLSGVFYLSAALLYLNFDSTRKKSLYFLATLLFLLALGSKTVTATLPAALLVILWWQRGRLLLKRDVAPLIPWFIFGLCGGALTALIERKLIGAEGGDFQLSFLQRGLIAGRVIWFYLGKIFWPARLMFIYPRWDIDPTKPWQYIFPIAAAALLIALWLMRRKWRSPLTAMLLFVGTLLPALGFFNVYPFVFSFVADHFQYLASIGIIAFVAAMIALFTSRNRVVGISLGAILLSALAIRTWQQSGLYRNSETLYLATLDMNPDCWLLHNDYGYELLAQHKTDEAIAHFKQTIKLRPNYFPVYNNYANGLYQKGEYAEALAEYRKSVALEPENYLTRYNLGLTLEKLGRHNLAIEQFYKSCELNQDYPPAKNALDNSKAALAKAQKEVVNLRNVMRAQPDNADACFNFAQACATADQPADALFAAEKAMQIAQKNSDADAASRIYQWLTLYRAHQKIHD